MDGRARTRSEFSLSSRRLTSVVSALSVPFDANPPPPSISRSFLVMAGLGPAIGVQPRTIVGARTKMLWGLAAARLDGLQVDQNLMRSICIRSILASALK